MACYESVTSVRRVDLCTMQFLLFHFKLRMDCATSHGPHSLGSADERHQHTQLALWLNGWAPLSLPWLTSPYLHSLLNTSNSACPQLSYSVTFCEACGLLSLSAYILEDLPCSSKSVTFLSPKYLDSLPLSQPAAVWKSCLFLSDQPLATGIFINRSKNNWGRGPSVSVNRFPKYQNHPPTVTFSSFFLKSGSLILLLIWGVCLYLIF